MESAYQQIRVVAFDADDTLWHNETRFRKAEQCFKDLLKGHASGSVIDSVLYRQEIKNIKSFGYGAKTFTLSMVEAAIELSERSVTASQVEEIIAIGNGIIEEPLIVFDEIHDLLEQFARHYDLMMITKGDLMEQENKIRRSGLGNYFRFREVVSEKSIETYRGILEQYRIPPREFLMIGNSLKSDILPVRELGAAAIHVPYHTTWVHETVPEDVAAASDHLERSHLREVLALLAPSQEPSP